MRKSIFILSSIILFVLSYIPNYNISNNQLKETINEIFTSEAEHWGDSIMSICNLPFSRSYSTEKLKNKSHTTMITKDDTIIISRKYHNPENITLYHKRNIETSLIMSGRFNVNICDSLFNASLKDNGIECTANTALYAKDLKEMFPQKDSLRTAAQFRTILQTKDLDGFTTDSVPLGIGGHGVIVGFVDIPSTAIIGRMDWFSLPQWLVIILIVTLYTFANYIPAKRQYMRNVKFIGNSCIDFNNNVIYRRNGSCIPVAGNKVLLLKMLSDATPDYKLLKEDICHKIWNRDGKDGQALYNVAVSDLRNYLIADDDSLVLKTLPKEGIQLIVDTKKVKGNNRLYFLYRIFS